MKEITILFTKHKENGVFTSSALINILNSLKPDVIFLEHSPSEYQRQFVEEAYTSLESEAIRAFKERNDVRLVPTGKSYSDEFLLKIYNEHQWLSEAVDAHSTEFFRSKYSDIEFSENFEGFTYINSDRYGKDQRDLDSEEEKIILSIKNSLLTETHQQWLFLNSEREEGMLAKIRKYSSYSSFTKAALLIGAAHRNSIINKVKKLEDRSINWQFYDTTA
jgi:hypothetical protein